MDSDKNLELEIEQEIEQEILFDAIKDEVEKSNEQDSDDEEKVVKPKKRRKRYKLRKGIQIRTVIMLLVTLIVNTYAWFIYVSTVSTNISMHIKDWQFELSAGEQEQDFNFTIDELYPGIDAEDTAKDITAKNSSTETTAILSCEITYMRILNDEFSVGDTYTNSEGVTSTYTSDDLLDILYGNVDYPKADENRKYIPFDCRIYLVDSSGNKTLYDKDTEFEMISGDEINIRIQVDWDYEKYLDGTNDVDTDVDANDTAWGEAAYDFATNENTKDLKSVVITMKVKAVQKNDGSNVTNVTTDTVGNVVENVVVDVNTTTGNTTTE